MWFAGEDAEYDIVESGKKGKKGEGKDYLLDDDADEIVKME